MKKRQQIVSLVLAIGVYLCIMLLAGCKKEPDVYLEAYSMEQQSEILNDTEGVTEQETELAGTEEAEPVIFYVYVCGAVAEPGVYALPEGSRVYEAIEMAGGVLETADKNFINQAELIFDGQMIRVYTAKEVQESGWEAESFVTMPKEQTADTTDDKVNINTATKSELMTLPGIGSAKAEAILAYREENGLFLDVEDLMNIPGIKSGVFLQIKELIKVN